MQVLLGKIKYHSDWDKANSSYEPLQIRTFINKAFLAQTEDQYPFASVYYQYCFICSFS